MTTLYVDDMDGEGTSPITSHPRFVAVAPDWFYEEMYDFAPFGSDDGSDALRGLEDWLTERGAAADPGGFLTQTLAESGFEIPVGLSDAPEQDQLAWARADAMNEQALMFEACTRVAAALGQVKITGTLSPTVLAEGRRGLRVWRALTADTTLHPNWRHRDEALGRLVDIGRALDAFEQETSQLPKA
ncbi:hypothetical protein [Leucobacter sp. M11]|uniref:hypothetical protein n=1 Tax=Leucobacter sp. M11 TaxID=2993565 RepID=UPI002D7E4EEC|nr:hypothetical protein [Leucobacter sp. M11]MEB4613128.1 hypothetical protein [Leucobacter sp. M11]